LGTVNHGISDKRLKAMKVDYRTRGGRIDTSLRMPFRKGWVLKKLKGRIIKLEGVT